MEKVQCMKYHIHALFLLWYSNVYNASCSKICTLHCSYHCTTAGFWDAQRTWGRKTAIKAGNRSTNESCKKWFITMIMFPGELLSDNNEVILLNWFNQLSMMTWSWLYNFQCGPSKKRAEKKKYFHDQFSGPMWALGFRKYLWSWLLSRIFKYWQTLA